MLVEVGVRVVDVRAKRRVECKKIKTTRIKDHHCHPTICPNQTLSYPLSKAGNDPKT